MFSFPHHTEPLRQNQGRYQTVMSVYSYTHITILFNK